MRLALSMPTALRSIILGFSPTGSVKALQGLDMLDVSVKLCVQESVVQGFEDSDEGASPN